MASSVHRKVSIGPNDTIIFSSNPIPGNEKAVTRVINELEMKVQRLFSRMSMFPDMRVRKRSS